MILNIRGASGSGKSTLARKIMDSYGFGDKQPVYDKGRRKPLGYIVYDQRRPHVRDLFVLGHYEIANGGMDTVDLDAAYAHIAAYAKAGYHVLYEGKTLRDTARNVVQLDRKHEVRVIVLNTSVDECVRRIRQRKSPSGKFHDIAPRSVEAMAKKVARDAVTMEASGVRVYSNVSLDEALPLALQELGL